MRRLLFLGTAAGMPIASHSTAIQIEDDQNNLLLDVSGGHNILRAFREADRNPLDVQHIFISHYDSDHILGIVPLVRVFSNDPAQRTRTVHCSRETVAAIETIFTFTAHRHYEKIREQLVFDVVNDGEQRQFGDWDLTFFDVGSTKTPQLGCTATFVDGKRLAYLGDEPLNERYLDYIKDSEVLIHEAFCTSDEIDRFKPHEKHHGTAQEAARNAVTAGAKSLALFHMEDETLATRKEKYLADARAGGFTGPIFVPMDSDQLEF